jgi:hypothetical protein
MDARAPKLRRQNLFGFLFLLVGIVSVYTSIFLCNRTLLPRFAGYTVSPGEHLRWKQEHGKGLAVLVTPNGNTRVVAELQGSLNFWYGLVSLGSGFVVTAIVTVIMAKLWPRADADPADG